MKINIKNRKNIPKKILCIKDSITDANDGIVVTHGKIYTLEFVMKTDVNVIREDGFTENSIWYQLLETGNHLHHSSLFIDVDLIRDNKIDFLLQNDKFFTRIKKLVNL